MIGKRIAAIIAGIVILVAVSPAVAAPIDWQQVIGKWQALAIRQQQKYKVPGWAAAIVVNNRQIYANGFGRRSLTSYEPVNANTLFQIASLSKAFTVALIAQEVDRKKIAWDSRVIDYLPQFKFYDPAATRTATVTDVFAQHSGLKTYVGDIQANLGFSRDHIIQSFAYIKPIAPFRSQYNYQNCLFLVGARLEEKLSGMNWEKSLRERLFIPLNMTDSSATRWGYDHIKNRAGLHQINDNGQVVSLTADRYINWVYTLAPAAGINSTVNDMSKWMIMHLNCGIYNGQTIIGYDNLLAMRQPQTAMGKTLMGEGSYYCMGWILTRRAPYDIVWHNGGSSGNSATIMLIPQLNAGIVILANLNGHFPYLLAREFYDILTGADPAQAEKDLNEQTADPGFTPATYDSSIPPSLPLARYAGRYNNPVYGPVDIHYDPDRGLYGEWGANQTPVRFYHLSGDTFALSCQLSYPVYEPVTFTIADGRATGFSVKCFRDEGVDLFTRQP
ncbi:MAG: serine hydrolase [Negativicutes bacterium]|nr:serine hydrolase [Negativicutes bacterium]